MGLADWTGDRKWAGPENGTTVGRSSSRSDSSYFKNVITQI